MGLQARDRFRGHEGFKQRAELVRSTELSAVAGAVLKGVGHEDLAGDLILPIHGRPHADLQFGVGDVQAHGGRPPDDVDWTASCALLLGGEGGGLPPAVIDAADERVTIPMAPRVESLNVAVAGALLVYAARRQRVS